MVGTLHRTLTDAPAGYYASWETDEGHETQATVFRGPFESWHAAKTASLEAPGGTVIANRTALSDDEKPTPYAGIESARQWLADAEKLIAAADAGGKVEELFGNKVTIDPAECRKQAKSYMRQAKLAIETAMGLLR